MRWWKDPLRIGSPIVFGNKFDEYDKKIFGNTYLEKDIVDYNTNLKTVDCMINYSIGNEKIHVLTDCVNKPHLIRVSYNPGWGVTGAKKVYHVSPSFMLVCPW